MPPSQAQKHVTHNEALNALDAIVQLSLKDRDLTTPPVAPDDGERYLVANSGTRSWVGKDGMNAAYQDGAWSFFEPRAGWVAWVEDEKRLMAFSDGIWSEISPDTHPILGINTGADPVNRLAVKADSVLHSHDDVTPGSGSARHVINKAGPADTASHLFQTNFSGRAEFGLSGDDYFHIKTSADGANWREALIIDPSAKWFGIGGYSGPRVNFMPVGGSSPTGTILNFDIGNSWYTELAVLSHDNAGNASQVGYRSRGRVAAPTAVVDDDWLFSFFARGNSYRGGWRAYKRIGSHRSAVPDHHTRCGLFHFAHGGWLG